MENTEKLIDGFIEQQKHFITDMFNANQGLPPMVSIFTQDPKKDCFNVNVLPILDSEQMNDKDFIRDVLIEDFKKMVRKSGQKIICVNWCSEAWMYKVENTKMNREKINNGDYKKLPRTEVLVMSFDGKDVHKRVIYEIKRTMSVTENGLEQNATIELSKVTEETNDNVDSIDGRFKNLFE